MNEFELKKHLRKIYGVCVGKRIKYLERGDEKKERLYEVKQMYPHCVLLEDLFDHTRTCPCYGKLNLMLRGVE